MKRFYIMKLNKFTVVLAVLLISILAIGAVSAESVDDAGIVAVGDGDIQESVEVTDTADDLSTADNADEIVNDDSGAAIGEGTNSYDLDDDTYSTYFNDDGTATEALSADGDYTLNIGTLTNKDIKITSGSNINITAKEGAGFINNGTIYLDGGYDGLVGSVTISGLTFTNTNKGAIDIAQYCTDINFIGNTLNIVGDGITSITAIAPHDFIYGLNIIDNKVNVTGDASYTNGIYAMNWASADTPSNFNISGNTFYIESSATSGSHAAVYIECTDSVIENNDITVKSLGTTCGYGIQVPDSEYLAYMYGSCGAKSPSNFNITNNRIKIDTENMAYGITYLSYGVNGTTDDYDMPLTATFPLNVYICDNNVVINSKKGAIGIGGLCYNMTVTDNDVTVIAGSPQGVTTSDSLGAFSCALLVMYDDLNEDEETYEHINDYRIFIENNKVLTNVTGEFITDSDYLEYVTFDNEIIQIQNDEGEFIVTEETFDVFFDENGILKDLVPNGSTLLLGNLTNKNMKINAPLVIKALDEDSCLTNSTISLVEGADGSIIDGLNMKFTGDENSGGFAVISAFEVSDIIIANNNIEIPDSKGYGYAMAIEVEGLVAGCDNVRIIGNTIDFKGSTSGMYGIDVFTKWKSEALNTNVVITDNIVNIEGATAMAEPIYLSTVNTVIVANNTLTSQGGEGADVYGIGASSVNNAIFEDNTINAKGTNMAYGISNTYSENVTIKNNDIVAKGTGAIGVGLSSDSNVEVATNKIAVDGGDFTTISTWDSVGTGNGAIVVRESNTNVTTEGNDVDEYLAVTLECTDLTVTAAPTGQGTFKVTLKTLDGKTIANKEVTISFNNEVIKVTTDANGVAEFSFDLNKKGTYPVSIAFLGDREYKGAFTTATITIDPIKTSLTASAKTYLATAKTKSFTATLKDANGNILANKKVTFTVNGKTYTATTNAKGVATVKLALTAAKTYTVTIKFAGDSVYAASTVSAKVKLNKEKTKITAPKKTFKRTAKTKKVVITLKNSKGKAIAKKKVTLIVNKKKYTVKTNKKGKATFKVKLTKRGTFKYTAKFAGDTQYKAVKKTGKIKIK